MESEDLEFNIRTIPAGSFTGPPNQALQKTIAVSNPIPYQLRPRSRNEIVFVISSHVCFLRFMESLLEGLLSLEGARVFAEIESIKQLISERKVNLTLSTAPGQSNQETVSKICSLRIDGDPRHFSKYFVVITLGYLLSLQTEAHEEGVETFRLVERIRDACARDNTPPGGLVLSKADQYIKKYPHFDPRLADTGLRIQFNYPQNQPMIDQPNPFNSNPFQLVLSNNELQQEKSILMEVEKLKDIQHQEQGLGSSVRLGTSSRNTTSSVFSRRNETSMFHNDSEHQEPYSNILQGLSDMGGPQQVQHQPLETSQILGQKTVNDPQALGSSFIKKPQSTVLEGENQRDQPPQANLQVQKTPFDESNSQVEQQPREESGLGPFNPKVVRNIDSSQPKSKENSQLSFFDQGPNFPEPPGTNPFDSDSVVQEGNKNPFETSGVRFEEKHNEEVPSKPNQNPTQKTPFDESSSFFKEPQLQPDIPLKEQNPFSSSVVLRNQEVQQGTGLSFFSEDPAGEEDRDYNPFDSIQTIQVQGTGLQDQMVEKTEGKPFDPFRSNSSISLHGSQRNSKAEETNHQPNLQVPKRQTLEELLIEAVQSGEPREHWSLRLSRNGIDQRISEELKDLCWVQIVDQVFRVKETTLSAFFEYQCMYPEPDCVERFCRKCTGNIQPNRTREEVLIDALLQLLKIKSVEIQVESQCFSLSENLAVILQNDISAKSKKYVASTLGLKYYTEIIENTLDDGLITQLMSLDLNDQEFKKLNALLLFDITQKKTVQKCTELHFLNTGQQFDLVNLVDKFLTSFISEIRQNVIPIGRVVDWMVAISNSLNEREDRIKVISECLRILKYSGSEESALKAKIGLMFCPENCQEIKETILQEMTQALKAGSRKRELPIFIHLMGCLKEQFLIQTETSEITEELLRGIGREWLLDFDVMISQLLDEKEKSYATAVIELISGIQNKSATAEELQSTVLSKMREFIGKIGKQELTFFQFQNLKGDVKKVEQLVHSIVNYIKAGQFKPSEKVDKKYMDSFKAMQELYAEKERIVSTIHMLIDDEEGNFAKLSKEHLIENLKQLQDPRRGNFLLLKKCTISQQTCKNLEMFNSLKKYNWIAHSLNNLILQHQKSPELVNKGQVIDLVFFENMIQRTFDEFSLVLKQSILRIPESTYFRFENTFKVFQEEWKTNTLSTLVKEGILTSEDSKKLHDNLNYLALLKDTEPFTYNILMIQDFFVTNKKIEKDSNKIEDFVRKNQQNFELFAQNSIFERGMIEGNYNEEENELLQFVISKGRLISLIPKTFKLILAFKDKESRHFDDIIVDRDSNKYNTLTSEFIESVRAVVERFKVEDFNSIQTCLSSFESIRRAVEIVAINPSLGDSLMQCSLEFLKDDKETNKIEKIMSDSRILLLYEEARQKYTVFSAFERPEEESFKDTKVYVQKGEEKGKKLFNLEEMQDVKFKIALTASMDMEGSNIEFNELKRSYGTLMKSLERIQEAIIVIKRRGCILSIYELLQQELEVMRKENPEEREAITKTLDTFKVNGSDFMLFVKKQQEMDRETYYIHHAELIALSLQRVVEEMESSVFETKLENHWMHFLDGIQLEMLLKIGKSKEEGMMDKFDEEEANERAVFSAISMIPGFVNVNFERFKDTLRSLHLGNNYQQSISAIGQELFMGQSIDLLQLRGELKIKLAGFGSDRFKAFFDILALINYKHEIHPSQVFFASSSVTTEDMQLFLRRAFYDAEQRWYFILDLHLLTIGQRNELLRLTKQFLDSFQHIKNTSMIYFMKKESASNVYNELNKYREYFENLALTERCREDNQRSENSFISNIPSETIISELSGLGKSFYIREMARKSNVPLQTLFISGEIAQSTIEKRISLLKPEKSFLHVKIDMMDNMLLNCEILDQILFRICFLRLHPYKGGWYSFKHFDRFFLEVSNNYKTELLMNVSFLTLNGKMVDLKRLSKETLTNDMKLSYVEGQEKKATMIVHAWNGYKSKKLGLMNLENYLKETEPVNPAQIKRDLFSIFLNDMNPSKQRNISEGNYNQLITLVNVVFKQLTEMNEVSSLNPDFHDFQAGDKRKEFNDFMRQLGVTRLRSIQLIFELANDLVWSVVSEVRKESHTAIEVMKNKKNLKKKDLEEYQKEIRRIPKWELDNKLNIIFNSGSMKVIFRDIKKLDPEIYWIVTGQSNRGLKDESKISKSHMEYYRMMELLEAMDLIKFIDNPEKQYLTKEEIDAAKRNLQESIEQRGGKKYIMGLQDLCLFTLDKKRRNFKGKGYSLTKDNYLKILNIAQRAALRIPIVIMGATGCGKTYMIDFIANFIFKEKFECFTLHSGVSEEEIERKLADTIVEAQENPGRIWFLWDEFNTSPYQSLITEIITERRCTFSSRIKNIPDNIVFVAACNPFRISVNNTQVGLVHESSSVILSHRVYPIPQTLIDYIWDFGQLSEEVETDYIICMMQDKVSQFTSETYDQEMLAECVVTCQSFLRETDTDSSVSLRDVQRFSDLYKYFFGLLRRPEEAMVMAAYTCYFFRIDSSENKSRLCVLLQEKVKRLRDKFVQCIYNIQAQAFIEDVKTLNVIPANISINQPLIENLLALSVATINRIPVIICGKPGTSKTVSVKIVYDIFNSPSKKKNETLYFKATPNLLQIAFWGSITTTSQGIMNIFKQAKELNEKNKSEAGELRDRLEQTPSVSIVFDEIGLAEIADKNPLKVLHPLLEERNEIGFIGLSNWKLDLSKMNRVIFVARPDMSSKDLMLTCESKEENSTNLNARLKILSESYAEFRKSQGKETSFHPNFYGSRDFYQMIRIIKAQWPKIRGLEKELDKIDLLVETAIERNFSGMCLENGRQRSSYALRQLYNSKCRVDSKLSNEGSSSIELIFQNLIDNDSRHLMIFSESIDIDDLMVSEIKRFMVEVKGRDPQKFEFLRKSHGVEDMHSLFSKLQSFIKQGYTVVLKDLDIVYGCLYDLLNQNYVTKDGKKGCTLFFDNQKEWINVHDDFKCIILMEREDTTKTQLDIEKKQQPPFLNRFEKHLVLYEDLINDPQELESILQKERSLISSPDDSKYYLPQWLYHNLSRELVFSQGLHNKRYITRHANQQAICRTIDDHYSKIFGLTQREETMLEEESLIDKRSSAAEATRRWRRLQSRNMILLKFLEPHRPSELSSFEKEFLDSHPYNDLRAYLVSPETRPRSIIFTYSPAWSVQEQLAKERLDTVMVAGMDVYLRSIEERDEAINDLLNGPEKTIVLQFRERQEWRYIQDFRYKFDQIDLRGKRVLFLAHTTVEDLQENLMVSTSINLNTSGWDLFVIDNLSGCNYKEFFKLLGLTMDEILGQELKQFDNFNTRFFKDIVRENVKEAMIDQANHYDGLSRTTNFIWLLDKYPELFNHIVRSARAESSLKGKKLYETLASTPHLQSACRSHLDSESLVKEAVRVGYRKSIQKVLESIKQKIGFELLFLSHLVGNQEAVFLEWLDILQTSNPFPSVMFNREFEQVNVIGYYNTFNQDIQKGIEQIKKVDFPRSEAQLMFSMAKGPPSEQIENIIHRLMGIPVDLETAEFERECHSVDLRVLFAMQVLQKYLRELGSDDFLRLVLQMVSVLKYKDSFVNYFKALGSTVLLCLVLADLYKEDIRELVELNETEEKAAQKVRTALDNFCENMVLAVIPQIEDLINFGKIDSRPGLVERIGVMRELLRRRDSFEDRWIDCLRLMVKFMEYWISIASPPRFEKLKVGFNNLNLQTKEPQNMILEIIQLAVQSWDVQEAKDFLFNNLFEILASLDKQSVHRTIRLQCINLLAKPLFSSGDCTDTQVACFISFVVKNQLQALVPGIFAELDNKQTVTNNIRKYYFQFIQRANNLPSTPMTPKQLIQVLVEIQRIVDLKDTKSFYNQCFEFKHAMEAVRRKEFRVAECQEIDQAIGEMFEAKNNQSCLLLIKTLYGTYRTTDNLKSAGFTHIESFLRKMQNESKGGSGKMQATSANNFEVMFEFDNYVRRSEEQDLAKMETGFFPNFEILNNIALNTEPRSFEKYRMLVEKNEQFARMQNLKKLAELTIARREGSKREDLLILFMVGITVNMLETLGKADWLLNPKDYILVNHPTSDFLQKAKIAKELQILGNREGIILICENCSSILSEENEEIGPNDRCDHCERPSTPKRLNIFEFMQSFTSSERSQRDAVNYENPSGNDPSLWLSQCHPQELGQPAVAYFVHLLQHLLFFVRQTCCEQGLHFRTELPELDKEAYVIKHVKNDLLLLCETGQIEVEDVVKMYTVGVLILRNSLDKELGQRDGPAENGGDVMRREASKIFKSICAKLKVNLDKYNETTQKNYSAVYMKHNPQFEYIFGDKGNSKEIKSKMGQSFEDMHFFLQSKPDISVVEVIRELRKNSKKDLKTSFLLEVCEKQELLADYSRVLKGAKRFFCYFKKNFEMLLTKEDLEKLSMKQLIKRGGLKDSQTPNQELQSEFHEFVSCLQTLARMTEESPELFSSLAPTDRDTFGTLIAGDEPLLAYLVVDWHSGRRVLEAVLKDLVKIQNLLLERCSSLSVYQTGCKAKFRLTKVGDEAIIAPYEGINELLESHTVVASNGLQWLATDIDHVTSVLADAMLNPCVVPLIIDPFFDYYDHKHRDLKELVARVAGMLGTSDVVDFTKLLSESRFTNLGGLTIRILSPIEKILKLVLPRVSNANIYTTKSPVNQLIPESFANERRLLSQFTMADLEGIRRVIMISRWAAAFKRESGEAARLGPQSENKTGHRLALELKVLYGELVDPQTEKLSREKESRMLEHLSDLLEDEDYKLVGDIMHQLNEKVPEGSDSGKKLTVKEFPGVIKAIEEKYTLK
jgi:hypothetical protein